MPRLVCADSPRLIEAISGRTLVLRVDDLAAVADAAARVHDSENQLLCVRCELPRPLWEYDPEALPEQVPLALFVPQLGRFRQLAPWLGRLRQLAARIYLPADLPDNLISLRLLSSLGVACCATFARPPQSWEALADLATYALLGTAPHAPLDPFDHLADCYEPQRYTEWGSVTFCDPRQYLHLDAEGRVALSHGELLAGEFIADHPDQVEQPMEHPAVIERVNRWRRFFAEDHACARCPGWRVCMGTFAELEPDLGQCSAFFCELLDIIDQHQQLRAEHQEPEPWRP